ncbi:hypothetical protein NECID01_1176 [Nematocida sp. AWRm77]|nr:hypothetical protein NECID01_1176 [Nematocida sp. AWRm77]
MRLVEQLSGVQKAAQDNKEVEKLFKQAIELKRKSIGTKEQLAELINMVVLNNINFVQTIEFAEKQSAASTALKLHRNARTLTKQGVSDLIKFFEEMSLSNSPKK